MPRCTVIIMFLLSCLLCNAQSRIDSVRIMGNVKVTIDRPVKLEKKKKTILILYALPNGNTTEQTMGKAMKEGDDWHFDIQHIKAQTAFIREQVENRNIIVAYLENSFRSWPQWKAKTEDYAGKINYIVDTLSGLFGRPYTTVYLNGHSGGGSFIFGYLESVKEIPFEIGRISFIDSNYGYDSTHYPKLRKWLKQNRKAHLTVFAYNDSVALYNGKPVVSAHGGTWYKSHRMLEHFGKRYRFRQTRNDSLIVHELIPRQAGSTKGQIAFFLRTNPERKIYHTQQVELNGFIHSILYGTGRQEKDYRYFGERAYGKFIEQFLVSGLWFLVP
jgi:hypothetical protein